MKWYSIALLKLPLMWLKNDKYALMLATNRQAQFWNRLNRRYPCLYSIETGYQCHYLGAVFAYNNIMVYVQPISDLVNEIMARQF